jgi:hypothetical protein
MRVAEILMAIASWLESPDNEAMLLAEHDDESFEATALACLEAAEVLKKGAAAVDEVEPHVDVSLSEDSIDHLVEMATAFDASDDEELKKSASVLDEILLTIGARGDEVASYKAAQDKQMDEIKKKYHDAKKKLDEVNKIGETETAIKKSPVYKEYLPMEAPLSARTCPDHAGAQMSRVGEHQFQCSLDKKVYNYEAGYTTEKGEKVPGGSVAFQTDMDVEPHNMFDTRETRLNGYSK